MSRNESNSDLALHSVRDTQRRPRLPTKPRASGQPFQKQTCTRITRRALIDGRARRAHSRFPKFIGTPRANHTGASESNQHNGSGLGASLELAARRPSREKIHDLKCEHCGSAPPEKRDCSPAGEKQQQCDFSWLTGSSVAEKQ